MQRFGFPLVRSDRTSGFHRFLFFSLDRGRRRFSSSSTWEKHAPVTPPVDGQRERRNDVPALYVTWTGVTDAPVVVTDGTAVAVGVAAITARRRNQPRLASAGRSSSRERRRLARAPSLRTSGNRQRLSLASFSTGGPLNSRILC
ncbi:hypothetical protein MTO96_010804 [Rhipicephalus appendiculatus]